MQHRRPAPFASLRPLLLRLAPVSAATLAPGCEALEPDGECCLFKVPLAVSFRAPADGERFAAGAPVLLEALVDDSEQSSETLSTVFTDAEGAVLGEDLAMVDDVVELWLDGLAPGAHEVTLLVTDDDGKQSSDTVRFIVEPPEGEAAG
jgi:hypothetical protein